MTKTHRNFLGLELTVRDILDMRIGMVKTAHIIYRFKKLYNEKHENDDKTNFQKSEALKFYTLGRYLRLNHKIF